MRVAIVGSSDLARTLARRSITAGHEVLVADVGGPDGVGDPAAVTGAEPATVEEAAESADVIVLALPFERHRELPAGAFAGKVVVDASDYFPDREGQVPELEEGTLTSTELLAHHLAGARVVKAFNTINFFALGAVGPFSTDVTPVAVPLAGDEPGAKSVVADLVVDLGFVPVDVGDLHDSWRMQPGMPVHGLVTDERRVRMALDVP
ncbi:MAG: oxidoreductase coenzyme F420-dependent [Acidimicrobiales bacterium]|nr:oxidoreductase coenzyme F420-dependent [Acidimicrobiales bacterium]